MMGARKNGSHGYMWRSYLVFLFAVAFLFLCFCFIWSSYGQRLFIKETMFPSSKIFVITQNESSLSVNYDRTDPPMIKSSKFLDVSEEIHKCSPDRAVLKVFMYDLPSEFHFGLLDRKRVKKGVWPNIHSQVPHYPGGLNLQHSIEYWLTLDLLSSKFPNRPGPCTAIRVENSEEADIVFVPFFSSLSYNRFSLSYNWNSKGKRHVNMSINELLQVKLVEFLASQKEWRRYGGRDHVIVAHHPNSMLNVRKKLWPAVFILADFGRYPPNIANLEKDVVAPYNHIINTCVNDTSDFDSRTTLLYFQGAINRKDGGTIRLELFSILKNEKDVHFSHGSVQGNGIRDASQGMHRSKFCLNIAGDTPSSNRLFDAVVSHCVPVIVSDDIELPFEDVVDYSEFCIFVRMSDAVKKGFLINLIRGIGRDEWTRMWKRLKEVQHHFEFQYPSQKDDAVQMIWQAVARKIPAMHLRIHKARRFTRSKRG